MVHRFLARVGAVALLLSVSICSPSHAWDWTHFHGSDIGGVDADAEMPAIDSQSSVAWRFKLSSTEVGSPTVLDGKVYLLDAKPDGSEILVRAVGLTSGESIWQRSFPYTSHDVHKRNTFASSTPAVDSEHVIVCWSEPLHTIMKCLDHEGNEVWTRDFGTWQSQHGFGTSPRIVGDKVILLNSQQAEQLKPGQTPGKSRLMAINKQTGETIWETPLTTTRSCYGVPAVHGDQLIGANTGDGLFGVSIETGEMLWKTPVFEMRCCSSPIVVDDLAIGSSGSGGGGNHLVAVRIPSTKTQSAEQVYRIDRGAPYVPTSVVHQGRLFMIDDKGIASCADVKSGKPIWTQRIGGNFGSSPILVGDKVLMISLDGKATVIRAADKFEKLAEVDLGGPVGSSPAFADGRLLVRVGDELVCWK
ncbi:outer membrane protein assembly factor BamB family protein [Stieleria varia]|uniref:Outer membrane protein assembly factor BamB n=1 Tax=Stieleria varia TaxID=2528005 RepID=A0A5C6ATF3_9BACT|nr:PQQ-binding-like beta-propeller repeat protein [Stieleria varia]TWU02346.1 Outer membrane protein assembly factor BamB precursor [Stieleria varia]